MRYKLVVLAVLLWYANPAFSETSKESGQSLEQAANDPTASLWAGQVQNLYTGAYHNNEDDVGNSVLLRLAAPFTTWDINHIARATLPLVTKSRFGEQGLGDLVLFDLVVFDETWGRWGAGPVMILPTAAEEQLGYGKYGVGPAFGFMARGKSFMYGMFNQNLFSVGGDDSRDDVNISIIQPILSYALPQKWSLGTSEMNITYDWEKSDWTALPVGLKLAKLVKIGELPIQLSAAYEYNFEDEYEAAERTFNFTLKVLF